ncbi:iron-sulfur cluster repair di-iron protein [Persicobacter psychrovividus]|uniref:Iron-sulfur cluster repair di-iron protein n=1 Tax=Persicobacter psychrovividus TaxID=387638 RepID=A0ABN6L4R6_9BACT|nr:iron-sulfur cluster repair di-iron protein [Persicobacter psychrovividus]
MEFTKDLKVGELVAADYRTADVFKRNGLDFCCGGGISIERACEKKGLSVEQLMEELAEAVREKSQNDIDFRSWPLDLMVDYIEKTHHRYVRENVKMIAEYCMKIAEVHGHAATELLAVRDEFLACGEAMTTHMMKEEQVLFPFIKDLVNAQSTGATLPETCFGSVENPIAQMEHEHDAEGERFRRIAALTDNYNAPEWACNTYRIAFEKLREFEADLHRHVHIENNILFPRAIELAKSL